MKVLLGLIALTLWCENILVQGAGRAIPVASENYVVNRFQSLNRRIEYDHTNFLVDLSGNFAGCRFDRVQKLSLVPDEMTPEGPSIGMIQDYTNGNENHVNAVEGYLERVFDSWVSDRSLYDFQAQIKSAEKFGCSVRPGCNGRVSVACLFTPAYTDDYDRYDYGGDVVYPQKAKAFTWQQYETAEDMTGQKWDRSHFLENLSGFETECNMMNKDDDSYFLKAKDIAEDYGKDVDGIYEFAENRGSTQKALKVILNKMKIQKKGKKVGCSLIPDCFIPNNNQMFVVVSCVFEL